MNASAAAAPLFGALGDRHRLRIVNRLCDTGPSSTLQLTQSISLSRQATTKHLVILESVGLVASAKRGRERIWTVQPTAIDQASGYLEALSRRWDQALGRLQTFVED